MKIALVGSRSYPATHGGLEIAVEHLASELSARGHEVAVLVSEVGDRGAVDPSIEVVTGRALRSKHLHTASQMIYGLKSLKQLRPDIVHVHGVGPAFPLALHRRALGECPVVVTAHGVDWDRDKWSVPARHLFRALSTRGLRNASVVTAVSRTVAAELSSLLGAPVEYTPNGIAVAVAVPPPPPGISPGRYSVCVSRLTPEKNIEQVVAAYDKSVAAELGKLFIIGDGAGSYASEYAESLRRIPSESVEFVGRLSHKATMSFVANCGRFISASRLEAQPISVLEAMSFGKPLYLSEIPPHVELCQNGARYYKLNAPNDLRDLLLSLDRETYEKDIAVTNKARVMDLGWDSAVNRYEAIYSKLNEESLNSQIGQPDSRNAMSRDSL